MAADGLAALLLGRMYDRAGLAVIVAATLAALTFAPLAFSGNAGMALVGTLLWAAAWARRIR